MLNLHTLIVHILKLNMNNVSSHVSRSYPQIWGSWRLCNLYVTDASFDSFVYFDFPPYGMLHEWRPMICFTWSDHLDGLRRLLRFPWIYSIIIDFSIQSFDLLQSIAYVLQNTGVYVLGKPMTVLYWYITVHFQCRLICPFRTVLFAKCAIWW